MKKIAFIVAVMAMLLTGCGQGVQNEANDEAPSSFTIVEQTGAWYIVYHNDTKVMYTVSRGSHNIGNFTVLVNPDGTPMLWEE